MKKSSTCTKCQSQDVVRVPSEDGGSVVGNIIRVGWSGLATVGVSRYVCCDCGYVEEWVESPENLDKLRSTFQRA